MIIEKDPRRNRVPRWILITGIVLIAILAAVQLISSSQQPSLLQGVLENVDHRLKMGEIYQVKTECDVNGKLESKSAQVEIDLIGDSFDLVIYYPTIDLPDSWVSLSGNEARWESQAELDIENCTVDFKYDYRFNGSLPTPTAPPMASHIKEGHFPVSIVISITKQEGGGLAFVAKSGQYAGTMKVVYSGEVPTFNVSSNEFEIDFSAFAPLELNKMIQTTRIGFDLNTLVRNGPIFAIGWGGQGCNLEPASIKFTKFAEESIGLDFDLNCDTEILVGSVEINKK